MKTKLFNEDSILRKERYRVNFNKTIDISHFIDTYKILKHDFSKQDLSMNGFIISKKDRYFFVNQSKFFNFENFYKISKELFNYPILLDNYSNFINIINNKKTFISNDLNSVIKFIYYDLIIYLEIAAYKYKNDIDNSREQVLINNIVRKKLYFSEKQGSIQISKYKRSKIHEKSKLCLFWNKSDYSKNIPHSILKIAKELNIRELEFPLKYDKIKTKKILEQFLFILKYIKLDDRNFELRFKKIGHYKKEGLYIKNAKCIIVSPLYSKTVFHELGHHIYENKLSFYLDKQAISITKFQEIIEENIQNYSHKIKNHKIEELDILSETFAYWFEDQILSLLKEQIN